MTSGQYDFVHRHLIDRASQWRDRAHPRPAVFLDRDGVINQEVHYLSRIADLALVPGSAAAIARLNAAGFPVIVVTNQSGVARGYLDMDQLHDLHLALRDMLAAQGASVQGIYYSPYHPDGQGEYARDSICRKPGPGMLMAAGDDFAIDFGRSVLIGDRIGDLQAGLAAGCHAVMVRTGHGRVEAQLPDAARHAEFIAADLGAAVSELFDRGILPPRATS